MSVTPIARERLRSLVERETRRFTEMRPRSARLLEKARSRMPNSVPMTWMATLYEHPPIVVEGGSGATFADIDGNVYVDFNLVS